MRIRLIILLFTTLAIKVTFAQTITNSGFQQKGNSIVVNYKIRGIRADQTCSIQLFVSVDGGNTFSGPLKAVSGDIGDIVGNGEKSIIWNVFEEFDNLEGNIVFDIRACVTNKNIPKKTLLSYNFSPFSPFGLMFGRYSRWGYFAKVSMNGDFSTHRYSYSNGTITDYSGLGFWEYAGNKKYSAYGITFGALKRITDNFLFYGGVGYGKQELLWKFNEYSYSSMQKINDFWVRNSEHSYSGIKMDLGVILKYKKIIFSGGATSINAKKWDFDLGFGVVF